MFTSFNSMAEIMFYQSIIVAVFFITLAYGGTLWIHKKARLPLRWNFNRTNLVEGAALGVKVFLWVLLIGALINLIFPIAPHLIENIFRGELLSLYHILLIAISVVVLAPLAEEILFRGFLLPILKIRWGTQWALHGTSFLFASLHLDPFRFLPLYVAAYLIGQEALKRNSLIVAVIAHAVWNLSSFTLLLLYMRGGAF
ncbi:CPBP family intramembrane metalloprotease [Heliorestis acidaminivorans]|uniref:CPBP family intramembrane metalloprotease n=1 Tax=Heliorestis acidaminivorans TaxID=553427 RepID=A0A6I0EX46_9FIRM|nr:type II CAAX endopeptidase family protein [Heliorestis acidaminivorans]KAB2952727.1 CPBP family intramembrane metalloprotease [Heliorestis acidaminivorans]